MTSACNYVGPAEGKAQNTPETPESLSSNPKKLKDPKEAQQDFRASQQRGIKALTLC